jgi:hypothetical protein
MAFANEYLTDEEERKKYGSAHVTLDRERDAWLTRSGGAGRPEEFPQFFLLHWRGEEINMHAYESQYVDEESKFIITWKVTKMRIPELLEARRPEILEMVREAFVARKFGGLIQHDHLVKDVVVEFSNNVINFNPGDRTWM